MTEKLKIAIVGGGIGGAALAVSLRKRGFDPHIYERAQAFGEIGAGVQMTPNAVKIIRALGLYDRLTKVAFQPKGSRGRHWKSGRENFLLPFDKGFIEYYGAPYLQIHRADLLDLFVRELPASSVTFGAELTDCTQDASGVTLTFADGRTKPADLVIGADGVRSVVRDRIFGCEEPRWTGHMCYRALVPVGEPMPYVEPYNSLWMGPNGHVVTYYVRGGTMVNIVAVQEAPQWVSEGWNVRASRDEMLATYQDWHADLKKLFSKVTDVYRWGLFDRNPMPSWDGGRVTLLGDAAHPMLPFLSQGAAMAIEDGYVLAEALQAAGSDIKAAIATYDALRRPRTSRVQLESRKRGETYHLPSAIAQMKRDLEYRIRSIVAPRTTGMRADWVYEYDGTQAVSAR
ncbi:FAD-dependent monooxygenase [Shinella sp. BYT-45]|uniref:FAD-dependent monooxygenase n=1 Tax=Shinella sp. BYT-45 TaxID=3377377 RepID=UPI00397F622D